MVFANNKILLLLIFLLTAQGLLYSQQEMEVVLPEGLGRYSPSSLLSPDNEKALVYSFDTNKLLFWDLERNQRDFVITLEQAPRSLAFHPTKSILYVSEEDKVSIYSTENGELLQVFKGSNYVLKNGSPFKDNEMVVIDNDTIHFINTDTWQYSHYIAQEEQAVHHANFIPHSNMLFVSNGNGTVLFKDGQLYDNLKYIGPDKLEVFKDKIIFHNSIGEDSFWVYDIAHKKLSSPLSIKSSAIIGIDYPNIYHYDASYNNDLSYKSDVLIVTDVIMGKEKEKIKTGFERIGQATYDKVKKRMAIVGTLNGDAYLKEYDCTTKQFIEHNIPSEEKFSSFIASYFSTTGKSIVRVFNEKVLINDILTGDILALIPNKQGYQYDNFGFSPIINDSVAYILNTNQEDYSSQLVKINLADKKVDWETDLPEGYDNLKINTKKGIFSYDFSSYKNDTNHNGSYFGSTHDGTLIYKNGYEGFTKQPSFIIGNTIISITDTMSSYIDMTHALTLRKYDIKNKTLSTESIIKKDNLYETFSSNQNIIFAYNGKTLLVLKEGNLQNIDTLNVDLNYPELLYADAHKAAFSISDGENRIIKCVDLDTGKDLLQDKLTLLKAGEKSLFGLSQSNQPYFIDLPELSLNKIHLTIDDKEETQVFYDRFITTTVQDSLIIYDLNKNRSHHKAQAPYGYFNLSRGGNLIATNNDLKNLENDKLFTSLKDNYQLPHGIKELHYTRGANQLMYIADNTLQIMNLETDQLQYINKKYHQKVPRLTVLSDRLVIISDVDSFTQEETMQADVIMNLNTGDEQSISGDIDRIAEFQVTQHEQAIILRTDNALRIFDLNTAENTNNFKAFSYKLTGNKLAFDDGDKIYQYDLLKQTFDFIEPIERTFYKSSFVGYLNGALILTNGYTLIALDKTGKHITSKKLDGVTDNLLFEPYIMNDIIYLKKDKSLLDVEYATYSFTNNLFSTVKEKPIKKDVKQQLKKYDVINNDIYTLTDDVLIVYRPLQKKLQVYDLKKNIKILDKPLEMGYLNLDFMPVGDKWDEIFASNEKGEVAFINLRDTIQPIVKKQLNSRKEITGNSIQLTKDKLYVLEYGQEVTVYDRDSIQVIYSLIPLKDGEHIIHTPQGYYMSTRKAAKKLKFKVDKQYYTFEQFDLAYNRPDIILGAMQSKNKKLVHAYATAHEKRMDRLSFKVSNNLEEAPSLTIDDNPAFTIPVKNAVLTFTFKAKDENGLKQLVVKANDNLLDTLAINGKSVEGSYSLTLNEGKNLIEVFIINSKGIKSITSRKTVLYQPRELKEPKVYFVGIGISDYDDDNYDLKYAAKDIRDLTYTLKERYPNIIVDTLLNKDFNMANFESLKKKLAKANIDDKVIISLCGHGVLDEDLNWYFAPANMNFSNPAAQGLTYDKLKSLASVVKSRQKLITIDACHSGELDTEDQSIASGSPVVKGYQRGSVSLKRKNDAPSAFALMKEIFSDLSTTDGTVVISAAGGMEFAYESQDYKNGVFTYSLIDKLEKSIWNSLKISQLQEAVMDNVYTLTNGKQKPTVRTGVLNHDWILW
ncbi:MAG: hypothetical protein CL868_05780 [Cytophagaceae bacterium]|nr:hypothetical protein [Cytophagaceae bacterium]